jgi:hypothetical protein
MLFDALKSDSDTEYDAFVAWLTSSCVRDLTQVGPAAAIEQYLRRGYEAHLSPSELTDLFCVSSDSVMDIAALSEEDADAVVKAYDELNERLWSTYQRSK